MLPEKKQHFFKVLLGHQDHQIVVYVNIIAAHVHIVP